MINKLIIDGENVELTDKSQVPYKHTFAQADTHIVRYGIDNTDEICAYAFQNCTELSYIAFPSEIKKIKRGAFKGCTSLERVPLSQSIEYIGKEAFDGCTSLKEIDFEHENPPKVYCEFPEQTILYVPDDAKYEPVTFSEMNLDGTVQYFQKNPVYDKYELIYDVTFCDENGSYYRNKWSELGDDEHVIENKNKYPVEEINFDSATQINAGQTIFFSYTLIPENASNVKLHWVLNQSQQFFTIDTNLNQEDHAGEIRITARDDNSGSGSRISITAYAESGVSYTGSLLFI